MNLDREGWKKGMATASIERSDATPDISRPVDNWRRKK